MSRCPVCLVEALVHVYSDLDRQCWCESCGDYRFTGTAERLLELHGHEIDRASLSADIRRQADQGRPEIPFFTETDLQKWIKALT